MVGNTQTRQNPQPQQRFIKVLTNKEGPSGPFLLYLGIYKHGKITKT